MFRFVRTAQIGRGKMVEAIAFAHTIAAYISENYGFKVSVFQELFGDVSRVVWTSDHESLTAIEGIMQKINQDQQYLALVLQAQADEVFAEGSVRDRLLGPLPELPTG